MPPSSPSERRQYYRVEDQVGLEWRPVNRHDLPASAASCFEGSETLALQEELRRADQEIRAQINVLSDTDRNLAHILKLLNQKLDIAARIMTFQQKPLQDDQWRKVTLSEGGLSFICQESHFRTGDMLAIRLTMAPELSQLAAFAEVVDRTDGDDDNPAMVNLQFVRLEDDARQQIARHVLRLQARQRQQERENPR